MTRLSAPTPPPSPPQSPPLSPPLHLSIASSSKHSANKRPFLEWVPLASHPVFRSSSRNPNTSSDLSAFNGHGLTAWDPASSRLYLWDSYVRRVHRISVRVQDAGDDSEPSDQVSLEAAVPSETLVPSIQITYEVCQISLNADGSSLLLAGSNKLTLIYIFERTSTNDESSICRAVPVATRILSGLRVVQVTWHPFSGAHFGLLTSDLVFRLFDLSSDLEKPEQEFYLQPVPAGGKDQNALSLCPVAFSYGTHHLWDTFSIFFLCSDGSIYVLCPVVPFGSLYKRKYIKEIYEDTNSYILESDDETIVKNSHLAIEWLESTFPDLFDELNETDILSVCRAHPYAPLDSSLSLQGPLCKIAENEETNTITAQAVGFLSISFNKDSILITSFNSGHITINALADEIHPNWSSDARPHLSLDSTNSLKGVAMICDLVPHTSQITKTPPLLSLAVVDLNIKNPTRIRLFSDPVVPERFYCVHSGGVDYIMVNFLPFSDAHMGTAGMRPPAVSQLLVSDGQLAGSSLIGFVPIADPFGETHLIGVGSDYECVVIDMKRFREEARFEKLGFGGELGFGTEGESGTEVISKEVLMGPKMMVLPGLGSLKNLDPESIEGKSTLHHYIKMFRENYVEYAHKVHIEVKNRVGPLKSAIEEQNRRINSANKSLEKFEEKKEGIMERIDQAYMAQNDFEARLNKLKYLPLANKKPLSTAENDFKSQLDRFTGVELGALHSAIEALNARMKRFKTNPNRQPAIQRGKAHASEAQVSLLKSSLEKLSIINEENSKKLKLIEQVLTAQEK